MKNVVIRRVAVSSSALLDGSPSTSTVISDGQNRLAVVAKSKGVDAAVPISGSRIAEVNVSVIAELHQAAATLVTDDMQSGQRHLVSNVWR
jgi:hypothetical protein